MPTETELHDDDHKTPENAEDVRRCPHCQKPWSDEMFAASEAKGDVTVKCGGCGETVLTRIIPD